MVDTTKLYLYSTDHTYFCNSFVNDADFGNLNPEVKMFCHYFGRELFLVKFTKKDRTYYSLFYKSAGLSTPDKCSKGSTRPILGIMDYKYPNVFELMREYFPTMESERGWIGKDGSKSESDPGSFLCLPCLKYISYILDGFDTSQVSNLEVSYRVFMNIADMMGGRDDFIPTIVLNRKRSGIKMSL